MNHNLPFSFHRKRKNNLLAILLFLITVSAQPLLAFSFTQDPLTIELKEVTVLKLLETLEEKSGYTFLIRNNDLNKNDKVSIKAVNLSVEKILNQVLTPKGLSYEVNGNRITIYRPQTQQAKNAISSVVQNLTGRVTDASGEALVGVNIKVTGTVIGTITDLNGKFSLSNLPDNAIIEASYIGYSTLQTPVNNRTSIELVMHENTRKLDEVVVVGYGVQRKENLTGSVSSIKMDEVLGDRPVANAASALQGAIPGLQITRSSTPGQNSNSLNIRGTLSINGGGPLVLIDNVPGDISMINPEDIESVTALKDAASAAIYGARAAGGVVLITTKRPKNNTSFTLNYNNNFGFNSSINKPQQVPLSNYLQSYLDAGFTDSYWANGQSVAKWKNYVADYKANPGKFNVIGDGIYVDTEGKIYYLNEKDLFANMLETSAMNSHNLSAAGGTDKLVYRMSVGYNQEDGPLFGNKDQYKRLNFSGFISAKVTNWFTQEADFRYSQSTKSMPVDEWGGIYSTRLISYYPEGDMPSSISKLDKDYPLATPRNLVALANTSKMVVDNPRIFLKSIIKPVDNLEMIFEYTYNKSNNNYAYYSGQRYITTVQMAKQTTPSRDVYRQEKSFTDYNALNTYATYTRSFNDHNLKVMAGYNQDASYYEALNASAELQAVQSTPSFGGATGTKTITDTYSEYTIRSGFFRLNYNWNNRYLVEVNGRYDGSSKFPKSNRFGFFPSLSAGWQVAEEEFMSSTRDWLDALKFRASWGEIGNQAINPYQYTPTMGINSSSAVWLNSGAYVTTIGVPSLVSSGFTWETVATLDLGLDFSLFKSRLNGTFDWYQRDTKGMLSAGVEVPAVVGTSAPLQNVADMQTRGWELSLSWNDKIGKLGYRIGFNVYDHSSKITNYKNESGLLSDYYVGGKLNEIWGYVSDGYYSVDDFKDVNSWQLKEGITSIQGVNVRPGDVKFKNLMDDTNTTNQINTGNNTTENPGDRKVIGNSTSRYQFGANMGVNFAGFDLSVLLQGTGKRDIWINNALTFPFANSSTDAVFIPLYKGLEDYWKPISTDPASVDYMKASNPNAKYYRLYNQMQNVGSNTRVSDKYLSNGAYLRVKNITLSYVLPKEVVSKLTLNQVKMYVSIENPATVSSLPGGIDPETLGWTYPFYRTTSLGASITF